MSPTYEYLCESGHETEVVQSIKDDALTECPATGVDHNGDEVECHSPCQFLTQINKEECEGIEGYGKGGKFTKCGAPVRRLIAGCSFILKGSGWTGKGGS